MTMETSRTIHRRAENGRRKMYDPGSRLSCRVASTSGLFIPILNWNSIKGVEKSTASALSRVIVSGAIAMSATFNLGSSFN